MRDRGIADRLREAGLNVVEEDGWASRGSMLFSPQGVVWHHTASSMGRDAPSLGIVINGRPDLSGPLCNILVSRSSVVHIIAAGRANHAGAGSWNGLNKNASFFGIESENTGYGEGPKAEPWPLDQLLTIAKVTAALINYDVSKIPNCCQHKEYAPTRKIDMHSISGDQMRELTINVCNEHNGQAPAPAPQPVPVPPTMDQPVDGSVDLAAIAAGIQLASTQVLRLGSKGDAVKWAQALLNNKLGISLVVDGNFGPATEAAVKQLQANVRRLLGLKSSGPSYRKMPSDGIVGPVTWFWLTR